MENLNLIWDLENEIWICPYCGAIYDRPENQKPIIRWCMKCKSEWGIGVDIYE